MNMNPKQVMQRYHKELIWSVIAYSAVIVGSITALKNYEFSRLWQVLISLSPTIPVGFVIVAIMRLIIYSDELQQRIQLFAISFSAALTGLITFSYGLLENIGFPKFPTFYVLPTLIFIWGISLKYFEKKYQ
jgi:low affinity Fe/Cu permease